MRSIAIKLGATAGVAVLAFAACGCSPASAGTGRATVQGCTDFGVHAIEHHLTVTQLPAACAGLSKAERNQALGRAVYTVAGAGHHKAAWRARAAAVSSYLSSLIVAVPQPHTPPPAAAPLAGAPAAPASGAGGIVAALLAWLLTAGSGASIIAMWRSRGRRGERRPRTGRGQGRRLRLPPPLISGHLGLAVAGLAVWAGYLGTGWRPMAWLSAALLLPVAGLGMAVLVAGLQERPVPALAAPGEPSGRPAAPDTQGGRARPTALVAAAHGLLATATLLLVMLALVGAR